MLIKLYEKNTNIKKVYQIVDCLRKGGVIIYPTDTIYAFGCDMYNSRAIERISKIKGLPKGTDKYSLVCFDLSNLSDFTAQIDNSVFKLMKKVLPGPYTFILKANAQVPKIFRSKKKTVGIRVPNNVIAKSLVENLGNPILSSSVHHDDDILEYSTDPELIYEKYGKLVDMVIDGGFGNNEPSTVLDCTNGSEVEILRQGKGEIDAYL